jgi:hypothetical protein
LGGVGFHLTNILEARLGFILRPQINEGREKERKKEGRKEGRKEGSIKTNKCRDKYTNKSIHQ